ncbi:hypothetical protein L3Q82_005565 [Scortum barcoo]|uniref:Uncharacterized protein n=1 Tax=Scortum barcoo TaxID=214431 RepID=A0ACB8V9M5_9TELE|nr:hypothetical protein L3Q82_005565 [Scortum barcoo]
MVVDFRRPRPHPEPVIIKGDCVEVVHTYKYLGVQSTPVLPQKAGVLQHLQEAATDLLPVCGSERPPVRSSVLGGLKKKDAARLDKLVRKAGSVVGTELDSLTSVAERRTLKQAPVHHRQSKSSTAQRHLQAEEQLQ